MALKKVAGDFSFPVFAIGNPSRPGYLYVIEQAGVIQVLIDGKRAKKPFLDLRSMVAVSTNEDEEFGLFSMAFDPRWPKKKFVYVMYTNLDGDVMVARFATNGKHTKAKKGSRLELLKVVQPQTWHNGGQIAVGPDNHLYIGLGDGGDDFDTGATGQKLTTLLGKLLRYRITARKLKVPKDNPTLPGVGRTPIWALGLRNPWRFSFDLATGDLLIGDVGEDSREEIDYEATGSDGGTNFGWPVREGTIPFNNAVAPATLPLVNPIQEYAHTAAGGSVTGGFVYRGAAIPDLVGYYLYADWVNSRIWALRIENGAAVGQRELSAALQTPAGDTPTVVSFGQDADGELYVCDYFAGVIYRIVASK